MGIVISAQTSGAVKVMVIAVFVSQLVGLDTVIRRIHQRHFQAVFILIIFLAVFRFIVKEIVLRTVLVIPHLIQVIAAPGVDALVIVGPPAVAQTISGHRPVVGIIDIEIPEGK